MFCIHHIYSLFRGYADEYIHTVYKKKNNVKLMYIKKISGKYNEWLKLVISRDIL